MLTRLFSDLPSRFVHDWRTYFSSFRKILKMISRAGLFIEPRRAKSFINQNVFRRVGRSAQFTFKRARIYTENCTDARVLKWHRLVVRLSEHTRADLEVCDTVDAWSITIYSSNAYRWPGAFDKKLQWMSSRSLLNRYKHASFQTNIFSDICSLGKRLAEAIEV